MLTRHDWAQLMIPGQPHIPTNRSHDHTWRIIELNLTELCHQLPVYTSLAASQTRPRGKVQSTHFIINILLYICINASIQSISMMKDWQTINAWKGNSNRWCLRIVCVRILRLGKILDVLNKTSIYGRHRPSFSQTMGRKAAATRLRRLNFVDQNIAVLNDWLL